MTMSNNRRFALYTGESGAVLLDTATGARTRLPAGVRDVLAPSDDGTSGLAAGELRTSVEVWQKSGPAFANIHIGRRHIAAIQAGTWSADGKRIVTCGDDRLVVLWDARTLSPIDA